MRAISKKTVKVLDWMSKHPEMSARQVAEKFQIHVSRVYQLRKRLQEDGAPMVMEYHVPEVQEPEKAVDVDAILDARANNYGTFIEGAEVMQILKRVVHDHMERKGVSLAFDQREALDMIIHKMGRIVNGNPDHVDSWADIAGYATLVAERLQGNAR